MIKYLVMDVDGTLTDGKIYMGPTGEIMKSFNIKDGYGIRDILIPSGIIPVIITGRESQIVRRRCQELGIDRLYQGVNKKILILQDTIQFLSEVAYIGDDINDLECMRAVKEKGGIIGCPADAVEEVKSISEFVAKHTGGNGAVREFIEWIVNLNSA